MSKRKEKRGIIINLYRNYGFIKDENGRVYPFEFNEDMIKSDKNVQYIQYSTDVIFTVEKVHIRDMDIDEAKNVRFNGTIKYIERSRPKGYLNSVIELFKKFNISIPSYDRMKKEFFEKNDTNQLIEMDNKTEFDYDIIRKIKCHGKLLDEFQNNVLRTEDNILYEWLKLKGFHPYMLDYLVNGLFKLIDTDKNIESKTFDEQSFFTVDTIVSLNEIDKKLRGFFLRWILGIENAYKSLISRISSQEDGGKEVGINLLLCWESTQDNIKKNQYKRAIQRNKFLSYSEYYDYILGVPKVKIEDLLDQLDLSNLKDLLVTFNKLMKDNLSDGKKFFSFFIQDIVQNKELLGSLTSIRNAAAHDRPVMPLMFNYEQNPNNTLELGQGLSDINFKGWIIYEDIYDILKKEYDFSDKRAEEYINNLYGNIYRRGWFELNFIYQRFIGLFDSVRFEAYIKDKDEFFYQIKLIELKSIVDIIKMDYDIAEKIAKKIILRTLTSIKNHQ